MIEHDASFFGDTIVEVTRIRYESPLFIQTAMKVAKWAGELAAKNVKSIGERFLYGDLERKRRELELDNLREDIRAKRIKNVEAAFDLAAKIPNPELRQRFAENLTNSIAPFITEHPPILELQAIAEEDDDFPEHTFRTA